VVDQNQIKAIREALLKGTLTLEQFENQLAGITKKAFDKTLETKIDEIVERKLSKRFT